MRTTSFLKEFGINCLFPVFYLKFIFGHYDRHNKRLLENPGIDGKIILKWIFRKWVVGAWAGSSLLRIGAGGEQV